MFRIENMGDDIDREIAYAEEVEDYIEEDFDEEVDDIEEVDDDDGMDGDMVEGMWLGGGAVGGVVVGELAPMRGNARGDVMLRPCY